MAAGATLFARALASADAPSDATGERILDAALELAAASGLRNLTMDDVARRASVGRMTVYRRFGEKAQLIESLTAREARRCLAQMDAAARPDEPVADQVAAGFATSLRIVREHPLLQRLARLEPETVLDALNADNGALFVLARTFLAERFRASQRAGVMSSSIDVDQTAELLVRLAFSFVLIQDSVLPVGDDQQVRELARRLIAPVLSTT